MRIAALALFAATVLFAPDAACDEEPDAPSPRSHEVERHGFVVGNLLGVMLGRASVDAGVLVAPHIMPMASVHLQATPSFGKSPRLDALTGFGGEIGVRFYTDSHSTAGGVMGTSRCGSRTFA